MLARSSVTQASPPSPCKPLDTPMSPSIINIPSKQNSPSLPSLDVPKIQRLQACQPRQRVCHCLPSLWPKLVAPARHMRTPVSLPPSTPRLVIHPPASHPSFTAPSLPHIPSSPPPPHPTSCLHPSPLPCHAKHPSLTTPAPCPISSVSPSLLPTMLSLLLPPPRSPAPAAPPPRP